MYVTTDNGRIYNFQAADFKKMLLELIDPYDKANDYLEIFRILEYIICEENRYTNIKKIFGAPRRVISVDIQKYRLLG